MNLSSDRNALSGLGWVLDELVRLPNALRAVLLSADGLLAASSQGVEREVADRMAAAVSGMQSLSRQSAEFADCGDAPSELIMVQYEGGFNFLMGAGAGSFLALSATRTADVEALSYAMEKTIERLGQELDLAARYTPSSTP